MSDPGKAVFLSYASQDAEAAKRICEALRAAGVEVWFDQSELVGGDQWDAKIRGQIGSCALFVPIISASTQARREGYFRIEWKLAAQRTHAMADGTPFLLPILIDGTRDAEALAPAEFKSVQWTKLPGGETPPAFVARVQKLLGNESVGGALRPDGSEESGLKAPPTIKPPPRWLIPAIFGVAALVGLALWEPWRKSTPPLAATPAVAVPAGSAEIARVRARIIPDRWQKGDFEAIAPALDRIIAANPDEADAWALRSIINSLQVLRILDPGTQPLETGKTAAEHALRLAPESPLGQLALGMHLVANVSRGGDPRACREPVDRAVAMLAPDALTRYAELVSFWLGYDFENTERVAAAWLKADPQANYPAWIMTSLSIAMRRTEEVEKWAERSFRDQELTSVRALCNLADAQFFLRADLAACRATLERIPVRARSVSRVVHWRWLLPMAEGRWDDALQELAQVPDAMLHDVIYNGPKALLAGLAHQQAGRADAANSQFHEAERLLREKLAADPDNEALRAVLAVTLASAGRADEARRELALVEPLVRGRAPNVYRPRLIVSLAQAYGALGDYKGMAFWLRKLFAEPSNTPLTPASFRLDPRFNGAVNAPEIQALLKEFASLDQPPAGAATRKADDKSVAVLAFANLSDDKANEYFSDGISEELLNVLAKVPGLKVSARTSAFYFKGKEVPVPEIAKQLGVAYVVEGSVRKQGDKVRITAQLIKADGGFHVWSDTFTRDLKDIFAVQDEIAALIAQNLRLSMGLVVPAARRAVNPEAHQLVLEGRHFWNLRTPEGFDRAEAAYTKAIELDPQFAQAYAGLADVRWVRTVFACYAGANLIPMTAVEAATARALAIDPTLAEAYPAAGSVLQWNGRFGEAEAVFKKAIALNPNYALAHHWYSLVLESQGRLDDALAEIGQAIQLDPLSAAALSTRHRYLFMAGRISESIAAAEKARALRPSFSFDSGMRALGLLAAGRRDEALVAARAVVAYQSPELRWVSDAEAVYVLRALGHEAEAVAHVETLLPRMPADSYLRGLALLALDRWDEAVPYLERTPRGMQSLFFWNPVWDRWRDDPRFLHLMEKIGGMAEYKVARETLARMVKEQEAKK